MYYPRQISGQTRGTSQLFVQMHNTSITSAGRSRNWQHETWRSRRQMWVDYMNIYIKIITDKLECHLTVSKGNMDGPILEKQPLDWWWLQMTNMVTLPHVWLNILRVSFWWLFLCNSYQILVYMRKSTYIDSTHTQVIYGLRDIRLTYGAETKFPIFYRLRFQITLVLNENDSFALLCHWHLFPKV